MIKKLYYVQGSKSEHSKLDFLERDGLQIESKGIDDLLNLQADDKSLFLICLDQSVSCHSIELILSKHAPDKINIILKDKSFDQLYLCYKYKVSHVFDDFPEKSNLKLLLDKANLRAENNLKPNTSLQVMKLLEGSIKLKTAQEIFKALTPYLSSFSGVEDICLGINKSKYSNELRDYIKNYKLKRLFIGEYIEIGSEVAVPIYAHENSIDWVLFKDTANNRTEILNSYFFKFIENTLIYRKNKEKEQRLIALANTDEVTGLYNQRKLSEDLESAILEHQKKHASFSIMFIDIDHFKIVNDNFGHQSGSKILTDIGNALRMILRDTDEIYRYGGDEFVVLMSHVDISLVHSVANRVCKKIKDMGFITEGGEDHKLSLSIGIAEYPTDAKSAKEILKFADDMMYISKKSGRGKVFHINEVKDANTGLK